MHILGVIIELLKYYFVLSPAISLCRQETSPEACPMHFRHHVKKGDMDIQMPMNCEEDIQLALTSGRHRPHYIAGVVEYKPIPIIGSLSPTEALLQNVAKFEELIQSAADQNVDILVFPEYGITTVDMPRERGPVRDFLVHLPKIFSVPCNEEKGETNYQILYRLSCAAKRGKIYVVVNLGELETCDPSIDKGCPTDGAHHYNTNVVFDRSGAIISRYRKFHLYFEPQFNTPQLEYSSFETDFGVEFGLFTCFDIIFAHPAVELVSRSKVKNFVFPTAWVDELPFLTAIQAQSLWAHSNGVNLLASGYHDPARGSLGSGIYSRHHVLNYTFEPTSGTKLVVGTVPINSKDCGKPAYTLDKKNEPSLSLPNNESQDLKSTLHDHLWLREDLSNYTHKLLDPNLKEDSLCHLDSLCCQFKYDLILSRGRDIFGYFGHLRFLAFDGRRTVAAKTDSFEWQVCAVVHCLDDTLESCTERETSSQNHHLHPKFKSLSVEMHPLKKDDYGDKAAQPGLSLIDTQFNLIPQSYFHVKQWRDPQTKASRVKAASRNEDNMANINVKTIGVIQRIYGVRVL